MPSRPSVRAACLLLIGAAVSCTEPENPQPALIVAQSLATQSATVGTAASESPMVKVMDADGNPFPGAVVTFTVTAGGGSLTARIDTTNDAGLAATGPWLLGTTAGANIVTATVAALTAEFTATGTAGPATQMAAHAGNGATGTAGVALATAPAVIVKDAFGNPVAGVPVTFAVTSGNGSISGETTATNASGIGTLGSWTLGPIVGINTLMANAPGMVTVSFAAQAQPGAASAVVIQVQPARASSGAIIGRQPVIRLVDANGNLTASTATVTASVASGTGTLGGTVAVAAVGGVATFTNLAVSGTGATSIAFTVTGISPATSTSFTVAAPAGAAAKLGVETQVAGAVSAAAFTTQPVVEIQDAVGTLVTTASAAVTASIASGSGTLSGTTTVNTVNGMATFTDLRITGSGTSTLTFTAAALPSITSNNFTVAPPQVTVVEIVGGDRQAVMAGSALPTLPSVRVLGPTFQPVVGARVTFSVASGGGSITSTSTITNAAGIATAGTWTVGTTASLNTLTATVEGSGISGNPATFQSSACSGAGAGYNLTLCFTSEMTASQRAAFVTAAARWEGIITNEAGNVSSPGVPAAQCGASSFELAAGMPIDDLLIFAAIVPIDGPGAVLGSAGPCFMRQATPGIFAVGDFSIIGTMRFDAADMELLESTNRLNSVILHEMGHVIGIGTLWSTFGLLQLPSTNATQSDTHFTGANATAAFNAIGFASYSGNKVPVENTGGAGTANGHWRETILGNELMTGFLGQGFNPLTLLTVRSLQDLGFTVNVDAADTFSAVLAERAVSTGRRLPPLQMANDLYTGPLFAVDALGRVRRMR